MVERPRRVQRVRRSLFGLTHLKGSYIPWLHTTLGKTCLVNSTGQWAVPLCCLQRKHEPRGHGLGSNSTFWNNQACPTHPHLLQAQNKPSFRADPSDQTLPKEQHDFLPSNTGDSKRMHSLDSLSITSAL